MREVEPCRVLRQLRVLGSEEMASRLDRHQVRGPSVRLQSSVHSSAAIWASGLTESPRPGFEPWIRLAASPSTVTSGLLYSFMAFYLLSSGLWSRPICSYTVVSRFIRKGEADRIQRVQSSVHSSGAIYTSGSTDSPRPGFEPWTSFAASPSISTSGLVYSFMAFTSFVL